MGSLNPILSLKVSGMCPDKETQNLSTGVVEMSQRRLRLTLEPSELLTVVAADLEFLTSTFKDVDLALEAHKCCAWWNERGGFRNPKLAFINWLEATKRPKKWQRNDSTGMTRGAPPQDRSEFLRDYERRRGLTA